MTPTLAGRIQTRLALLATVGLAWTLLVTPLLPRGVAFGSDSELGELYEATITALAVVAILGAVVWEPIYHGLQQLRWEKDWPISIGLASGLLEGAVAFAAMDEMVMDGSSVVLPSTFWWHFVTTWIVVWLFANGPMRVVLLRWRYRGGRVR